MFSQSSLDLVSGRLNVPMNVSLLAPDLIKVLDEASNAMESDSGAAQSCLAQLIARLQEMSASTGYYPTSPCTGGGLAPWQKRRVTDHIEAHLDGPIRVADLAELARLSASYLSVAFKQSFGLSLKMFITCRRVERAQMLMLSTDQTLVQISLACGFCDQAHLCRWFRRISGRTPKSWRREHLVRPPLSQ
jgi:AraC family transcriptional regulator